MNFERRYSRDNVSPRELIAWRVFTIIDPKTRETRTVEAPATWSQNAATILATKYLRRAGVPRRTKLRLENGISHLRPLLPAFLWPRVPADPDTTAEETSADQAFARLAGHWTYWAWREGLVDTEAQARILHDELYMMLALQVAAPNSPQWFNCGLWWAYGIEGAAQGQWVIDDSGVARQTQNAYERPQVHACYIQPVADNLVNEGGMMDLWTREARLFKGGSGSGSNMSDIRGKGEPLSGGGTSSGLMSFLEVGDRSAGSIQSGGTTRRAALMRVLDLDHPEIEDFIWWKEREEAKAAAMSVGSRVMSDALGGVAAASFAENGVDVAAREAREAGIPEAMIDRAKRGIVPPDLPVGFESEPIRTVSGQNSNNTVRVTDDFLVRVDNDIEWGLTRRTDGEVMRSMPARDLWEQVCRATWAAGDPGVQFEDTINDWHTCPLGGRIRASNPCSEYLFLDDTACNLASLRLTAFLRQDGTLDYAAFAHATRLWTVVLDLSVSMASYPSREIALRSIAYRTLGLGHADLGGLLMRMGIPYDSNEGRALAGALTALLSGVTYQTSAELAEDLGSFPEWEKNSPHMRRVLRNHARACDAGGIGDYEGLSAAPEVLDILGTTQGYELHEMAMSCWHYVTQRARSFRNAQGTLLAPTGTIGLLMDCDTLGIEPDFALVKHKALAGGGSMQIVNEAVPAALIRLGYDEGDIRAIEAYLHETGELPTEGPVRVRPEHLSVFACAMPSGGVPAITPEAHVRMVAAVQPFLSGGVSKTVNLPRDATPEDIRDVYRLAHRLGVKAVAPYRDGCKLSQPLSVKVAPTGDESDRLLARLEDDVIRGTLEAAVRELLPRGTRELPPWERDGKIQKVKIGDIGQSVWITIGRYPDGRPCEVFLELAKEGSTLGGMADLLGMAISVGLQFGVPMSEFVERFTRTKFEPAGLVEGHAEIAVTSSIGDLLGRHLGIRCCGAKELSDRRSAQTEDSLFEKFTSRANIEERIELARLPTGETCPQCHNATLIPNGSCKFCTTCNESVGGCGA